MDGLRHGGYESAALATTSSSSTESQKSAPTTLATTSSQTSAPTTTPASTSSSLTESQTSASTNITSLPVTSSMSSNESQTSPQTIPTASTATTASHSTESQTSAPTTTPVNTSSSSTESQTSAPTNITSLPVTSSMSSNESQTSPHTIPTNITSLPVTSSMSSNGSQTSLQTSPTSSPNKESLSNPGATVGIVLAVISFLFIITLILFFYIRRRTKKQCTDVLVHTISNIPLRIQDYEEYFKRNHADSNCGFAEEYETLKTVGTAQSKNAALATENIEKNRYSNVLPYDSSRVKLSECGSPFDDYINANYIPGYNSRKEFIAAQGPLPITVNEFWRMVWEKNVYTIVMLTRCNEMGRVKCEKYWPSETTQYRNISITTTSELKVESWTIRDFRIKNVKTTETRFIRQFHFTAWPDHGVPKTTEVLIDFRHLVRKHMDQYSRHSPTVVHCSAGVGRTGTFIGIDHLILQIERDSMLDVYGIVNDMRMHRSLMVQTEEQYVYLHQCAHDIIRSRTGTNTDLIYQNAVELSVYQNCLPPTSDPSILPCLIVLTPAPVLLPPSTPVEHIRHSLGQPGSDIVLPLLRMSVCYPWPSTPMTS
ncbi:hypothetical protein QQF64_023178 [Cirrhinus molitorella]|uniref:Uncharacterized protein n=1 Tax=Cirrhinus molitorella TaxID=172907 RepID=A0ABR3L4L9_9TELE